MAGNKGKQVKLDDLEDIGLTVRIAMLDNYARYLMDLPAFPKPGKKGQYAIVTPGFAKLHDEAHKLAVHLDTPEKARKAAWVLAGLLTPLIDSEPEFQREYLSRRSVQDDIRRVRDTLFSLNETDLEGITEALSNTGLVSEVQNWTKPEYPAKVAKLLGVDKRTLLADHSIIHQQLKPPGGRLYRFDFDAIERRNPDAAEKLNPDTSA